MLTRAFILLLLASLQVGRTGAAPAPTGADSINTNDLLRHTRELASDKFEGRAPATRGEELTVDYLTKQFRALGLRPGNPDGTFVQNVPLVGVTSDPTVKFDVKGTILEPALPGECIAFSLHFDPVVNVTASEMIFVGYGVVAPEYGWDDYKGQEVRGKTIVMLINDPPVPQGTNASMLDPKMFKGREMTYYGRWTYKYEIAAAKGAAAAIIVHETGPAGYPYMVLVASNARENFDLASTNQNRGRVPVQGWLTHETARKLFSAAGHDFEELKASAIKPDFKPVPLGAQATFNIKNQLREVNSRNVVARLEGADPQMRQEWIVISAHWDHIGKNEKLPGDNIFNGAVDNAIGLAGLLELAEAFATARRSPARSVLFLALTAEEKGLLGAKYYVENPLYPLNRTVANLNMDGLNPWGRTRDIEVIGYGQSTLDDLLRERAAAERREVKPDSEPEKGRFFRSDHFEFARHGVPALYLKPGIRFPGQSEDYGARKSQNYTANDYHKVTDEVKPDWDLAGAVADLKLLFEVGYDLSRSKEYPAWKEGSEFKKLRPNATPR